MPFARRLAQIAQLSWRERTDLAQAVWHLMVANRRLAWGAPVEVAHPTVNVSTNDQSATPQEAALVARVAWAIPRAALVVPWRSDCLRQAEAARAWLAAHGLTASLKLGSYRTNEGQLETHAWLEWQGEVVTGGSIEHFAPFMTAND